MSRSLPLVTVADRRARLGRRHRLAPGTGADRLAGAADAVVALHATDAATVFLSARARLDPTRADASPAGIERALYEEVEVVRALCMRRTLFAFSTEFAPFVDSSTGRRIAAKERAGLLKHLAEDGAGMDAAWLAEVTEATLAALDAGGPSTGGALSAALPELRRKFTYDRGKKWETTTGVASRVLRVLAAEGRIRRDRPVGSWVSSQFRWTRAEPWPELPEAGARAELARRWLYAYGPASERDLAWWTGWTLTQVRAALAAVDAEEVRLDDGSTALVLPGDTGPETTPEPWAALLPALDPSAMGWADRSFHLDPAHRPALFDRAGNIGPTVWWNGAVVGGWAQRADGTVVWRALADLDTRARAAVDREAERLGDWLGPVRVTPRFRTPLERELTA
ncbi:winged helix DNA-binding domain-containing protein [Streptomyces sp. BI20]|uniref:winged helix DNA-binding domain-containing protein n=1 Tax=Streptomyces sp. BI20 TaxID=3403460 RepID=UPI003C75CCFB